MVCKVWEEVDKTLGQLVKWCSAILFLVVRLSSFRSVVEFLPVSPIQVAWWSKGQSPTTVPLRTPVTQTMSFNEGTISKNKIKDYCVIMAKISYIYVVEAFCR